MSKANTITFLVRELQELNMFISSLKSTFNLNELFSWSKPTKTYKDIDYTAQIETMNYQNILEEIVDRLYLILNMVLVKLEDILDTNQVNLHRPKRLILSSLSSIIIDKLSAFHNLRTKQLSTKPKVNKEMVNSRRLSFLQDGNCEACVVLFKQLNNISFLFEDLITFDHVKNARCEVRKQLFALNNSQSMSILCGAIHEDLRLFLADYRAINECHASLQQQYDKLMKDFIYYVVEYDARLAQNEDALRMLTNKVGMLHEGFARELQSLGDSLPAISAAIQQQEDVHNILIKLEKNNTIKKGQDQLIQVLIKRLEGFSISQSKLMENIVSSVEICEQKIIFLQTRLNIFKMNASNLKMAKVQHGENENNSGEETCVPLAGNNPIEDMLQHIESNKLKIDYLQNENVVLERTINRIKMRVTY